jgi:hypothetical protein
MVIEFPDWFDPMLKDPLRSLIQKTLDPDHTNRPSIAGICSSATRLVANLTSHEPHSLRNAGEQLIEWENILGTDVPSEEGYHALRWEVCYPGYAGGSHSPYIARCQKIWRARKELLGISHPNTFWSMMCLGWAMSSAGLPEAIQIFTEANEIAANSTIPSIRDNIHFTNFGLIWTTAESEPQYITHASKPFRAIQDAESLSDSDRSLKRLALAARTAILRMDMLWGRQYATSFRDILEEQKTILNEGHPELLETQTLMAVNTLFTRTVLSTSEARTLLGDIASSPTRLFRIEHPGLLTLCGLAWGYARKDNHRQEAIRIFNEAEGMQKRLLGLEYPTTTVSLEALATALTQGPIIWSVESSQGKGNNRVGSKGLLKCEYCRLKKIRVHKTDYMKLTV